MTTILNVTSTYFENPNTSPTNFQLTYLAASQAFLPTNIPQYGVSGTIGALNAASGIFPTPEDAISYYAATAIADIVNQANTTWGSGTYSAGIVLNNITQENKNYLDAKVDNTTTVNGHALSGNINVVYTDISGRPTLATVATSGSYLDLSNTPTINTPSFANPSRSLNSAFQISSTRNTQVSYSVDISCTMSLTSGQSGLVVLEYADDSGITTNVKTVARSASANSGALTIGLALTSLSTATVAGIIPVGKYARLRTVNTTGTPAFTLQNAQEVLV